MNQEKEANKLVSPKDAANILHVSKQSLRRYHAENKLRAVKTPGKHNRYLLEDIQAIKDCQQTNQPLPVYKENTIEINQNSEITEDKTDETDLKILFSEENKRLKQEAKKSFTSIGIDCNLEDVEFNLTVYGNKPCLKLNNGQPFGWLVFCSQKNQVLYLHLLDQESLNEFSVENISDIKEAMAADLNAMRASKAFKILWPSSIIIGCLFFLVGALLNSSIIGPIGGIFVMFGFIIFLPVFLMIYYPNTYERELKALLVS